MSRRQWKRRWTTWGLATLSLAFASAWAASTRVGFIYYDRYTSDLEFAVLISDGVLHIHDYTATRWTRFANGWSPFPSGGDLGFEAPTIRSNVCGVVMRVPLWLPSVAAAAAAWLIRRRWGRRYPPDHCQVCGHALRSNVTAKCPECGRPTRVLALTVTSLPPAAWSTYWAHWATRAPNRAGGETIQS